MLSDMEDRAPLLTFVWLTDILTCGALTLKCGCLCDIVNPATLQSIIISLFYSQLM